MQIFTETPRLILRELVYEDAEAMFEMDADPEVHRYLGNHPVKEISEIYRVIDFVRKQYEENGIGRWAVIDKHNGLFVGWAGLKFIKDEINDHNLFYDLGYRFAKKHWGKGYGTEAAGASLQYGFATLGLSEVFAIADTQNSASIKILEKLGFECKSVFFYDNADHFWFEIKKHGQIRANDSGI